VVTSDDKHNQLIAIGVDERGKPSIVNRADAKLGTGAVWGCGDKDLRYLAVSSGIDGVEQVANILKLDDFSLCQFPVTLPSVNGVTEELHAAVAGEPAHLFASVGGEIRVWPLADVLAGTATTPLASVPINAGSHGIVVSHRTGVLYITAGPGTGFDGSSLQMPFAQTQLVPWDTDGLSTGRNARPRLSYDGRYIYGAVAQSVPEGAERWAERAADLHVADVDTKTAKRSALTKGIVSKFQLSQKLALFANVSETGASQAILVDVVASSPTFQQVVARVPLTALSNGPVVGQSTTGKQALGSAITPDGKWAFVSHGGDGKISVIDTTTRSVVRVIETPTTLHGGGYMFAFQRGVAPVDTCTR
jgi:YVTN family beta-propeller protein